MLRVLLAALLITAMAAAAAPAYGEDALVFGLSNNSSTAIDETFPSEYAGNYPTPTQLIASGTESPITALSPDGQTLAYATPSGLYVRQVGGGTSTLVYPGSGNNNSVMYPRFTPDGKALYFTNNMSSGRTGTGPDIWRVNTDGTGAKAIIAWSGDQSSEDVSSDGTLIAFHSTDTPKGKYLGGYALWVANADGSNPRQVFSLTGQVFTDAMYPSFSPDMKQIAFTCYIHAGGAVENLCTASTDGTGTPTNITPLPAGDAVWQPRWSPDGGMLCAELDQNLTTSQESHGIALYKPDGTQFADVGRSLYNNGAGTTPSNCSFRQPSTAIGHGDYLAAEFMPILDFSSQEKWRPLNIPMFLSEQDPTTGQPWNQICLPYPASICGGLNGEASLQANPQTNSYIIIHNSNGTPVTYQSPTSSCIHYVGSTQVYDCDTGPASAIYYHVVGPSPGGYTYIEYLFFYRYNQGYQDIGNHAGDLEGVTVAASTTQNTFQYAEFSQHGNWESFLRDNLECDNNGTGSCGSEVGPNYFGQHVMTFPAAGSHANYIQPNSGPSTDGNTDGQAPWGRNLSTSLTPGSCPSNVPASPVETCGPALIALPPTASQGSSWTSGPMRWTDWPGMWGDTGASCVATGCSLGDSTSPTSPAAPNPSDHGPHYFAPWTGVTCNNLGAACPSSAQGPQPLACGNWFAASVAVLGCNESMMRNALKTRRLTRHGSFSVDLISQGRRAATAPGLAQTLGRPLQPGQAGLLSGNVPSRTELFVRASWGRRMVIAIFRLSAFRGTGRLIILRGPHHYPMPVLVEGRNRLLPNSTLRTSVPSRVMSSPRSTASTAAGARPVRRPRLVPRTRGLGEVRSRRS